MSSVGERVVDIVADQLGVDKEKIKPETSFAVSYTHLTLPTTPYV